MRKDLPKWKSPRRCPRDAPVLVKVRSGCSVTTTIAMWIGNRFLDLTQPTRRIRVLAWHCRVPSLDAR